MKKRLWKLVAATALVIAASVAVMEFSLVVVTNDSTADLSDIEIRSEAFQLQIATIRAGESRWFVRPAAGNCGIVMRAISSKQPVGGAAGFIIGNRHGYIVSVSLDDAAGFRVRSFPDAIANTSREVAQK